MAEGIDIPNNQSKQVHDNPVQTIAALTALAEATLTDKQVVYVEDALADYHYNAESGGGGATDEAPDDQTGGTGFWIKGAVSGAAPALHAASHTDGSDDIQNATAAQKGLATAAQITKLDAITGTNTGDEVSATLTVEGIVERATQAEVDAGTDTSRYVTPETLENKPGMAGLVTKSGVETGASFAGNPKIKTVTFSGAFADANYSVAIVGDTAERAWTAENIAAGSFDIHTNANQAPGGNVLWIAIKHGES